VLPSQVPGWISLNNERFEIWGTGREGVPAVNGVNFLELDYRSAGSGRLDFIYQDISTTVGQYYEASFSIRARRTKFNSTDETAIFSWNGVDTVVTAAGNAIWTKRTVLVVGTGGRDRFALRESSVAGASSGFGPLIDDVRLVALTCPGTPRTQTRITGGSGGSGNGTTDVPPLSSSEEVGSSSSSTTSTSSSSAARPSAVSWPILWGGTLFLFNFFRCRGLIIN
jgi:hypothetical protein